MTKMYIDRSVLEQALEALSLALSDVDWRADSPTQPVIHKAHVALCAAQAQQDEPAQEPVAHLVALELERLAQDPPISGNTLAQARVLMTAANVREFGLGGEGRMWNEPVEPVAKVELMMTGGNAGLATRIVEIEDHLRERLRPGQLLYTAPPQRKLVPLTEEEIYHATRHCGVSKYTAINITRAVEQAHGIKE